MFARGLLVFLISIFPLAYGEDLRSIKPERVGMSSERLAIIKPHMQRYVDAGKVAGIQTIIARNGNIVPFEHVGNPDSATGSEMTHDPLLRIASMTQPIAPTPATILFAEWASLYDNSYYHTLHIIQGT